ncbi:MAG: hypothetical protein M1157_00280 [Deinococcus sp.]|nr:hypothetical protein [Deinococcus sp.]
MRSFQILSSVAVSVEGLQALPCHLHLQTFFFQQGLKFFAGVRLLRVTQQPPAFWPVSRR